jgi:hypothetical protein
MATLTSTGSFAIVPGVSESTSLADLVLPSAAYPTGEGRIVHPTLGTFDYLYAPDEWSNLDGDVLVFPVWAVTKSLQGSSSAMWPGSLRDVTVEERWTALGGLSMPMAQLRTLLACAMNPVDPAVATMQLFPNYTTDIGYNVLLLDIVFGSGGNPGMANMSGFKNMAAVFNAINSGVATDGNSWMDKPVTVFWKILSKVVV